MTTIDDFIQELVNIGVDNISPSIPVRDVKILKNLAKLMSYDSYITQNQANLLLKILNENLENLHPVNSNLKNLLLNPIWSKDFKINQKIREVSIDKDENDNLFIKIHYSFDKEIKKVIGNLNKVIGINGFFGDNKYQNYTLVEKNIVIVYEMLEPLKFQFSSQFLDLYDKVKKIDVYSVQERFNYKNFIKEKLNSSHKENEGNFDNENPLIILDRKIRYQYDFSYDFEENIKNTLSYKIASRKDVKVFIDVANFSFTQIIESLLYLKRDKIFLIFDDFRPSECIDTLKILNQTAEYLGIQNIGIYFRFDNTLNGSMFNKMIAENNYNKMLDMNTSIVGINNGKIPKFMIKNSWYPDAVVSFTNSFRNNRSDVYCNNCDLIIYYTSVKPLISKVNEIL